MWKNNISAIAFMLALLVGCTDRINGSNVEKFNESVENISKDLSREEAIQFRNDIRDASSLRSMTMAHAIISTEKQALEKTVLEELDGKTKEDIKKMAQASRISTRIKETNKLVEWHKKTIDHYQELKKEREIVAKITVSAVERPGEEDDLIFSAYNGTESAITTLYISSPEFPNDGYWIVSFDTPLQPKETRKQLSGHSPGLYKNESGDLLAITYYVSQFESNGVTTGPGNSSASEDRRLKDAIIEYEKQLAHLNELKTTLNSL